MTIRKINDFFINEEANGENSIGIDSNNLELCIGEIKTNKYSSIFCSPHFGFNEVDLDFLSSLTNINKIHMWDINLKSIEGLYELKCLKDLSIHGKRPGINFEKLDRLSQINLDWNVKDCKLNSCKNINKFTIWNHKPKSRSFVDYSFPVNAQRLQVSWSNVNDLSGIDGLNGLREFEIHMSRNLISLNGLEKHAETLEKIIITTCPKLVDFEQIKKFHSLTIAIIDGKRIVDKT